MARSGITGSILSPALKQARPVTGGITDGLLTTPATPTQQPWQETWVEKRDREAALQTKPAGIANLTPAPAASPSNVISYESLQREQQRMQPSNVISYDSLHRDQQKPQSISDLTPGISASPAQGGTWIQNRDRDIAAGIVSNDQTWTAKRDQEATLKPLSPVAGLAKGGPVGRIPGKVNHAVADDVTINAKKGEYVIPQEVVSHLGERFFNNLVTKTRKQIGVPQGTGAKNPSQPDNMGRRDKPGLPGIAGMADGGSIYGTPEELAQRPPLSQQIADVGGKVANALRSIPGVGYNSEAQSAPAPAPIAGITELQPLPSHTPGSVSIAAPPSEYRGVDPATTPQQRQGWIKNESDTTAGTGIAGVKQFSYDKKAPAGTMAIDRTEAGITGGIQQSDRLWKNGTADNPTAADQQTATGIAELKGSAAYFDPAGNKHTITRQLDANGKPMLDAQGKPITAESSIGWTNSYQGPTALDAAKEGVKARLGYIPVDYDQNREKYDMALAGQAHSFDANTKALEAKKIDAASPNKQAEATNHQAQAGLATAHADYFKAISSPEYLKRQERIAGLKDATVQANESQKLNFDMAKTWVKGATGLEHPDHISAAMAYIGKRSEFEKNFDGYINKLSPTARQDWVKRFKAGDPQIIKELGKRGIVAPKAPEFGVAPGTAGGTQ